MAFKPVPLVAAGTALQTTSSAALTSLIASETSSSNPGQKAIDVCMSAWNRVHDELAEEGTEEYMCKWLAHKAYLRAAPPLHGYKNICDFIACINYASLAGFIIHIDAKHYLENARVALSAIYHQPKSAEEGNPEGPKNSRRKPRKS
jgi:hypothetical protein